MSNYNLFKFTPGTILTVVTNSGAVYVGAFISVRHCTDSDETEARFIILQLTSAVSPYVIGDVIAITINEITSIGPLRES
ncbi:hypothetical protein [Pelosinus propionicus]|uniref:Uncharacterized protein n=1 Tax=Pelosinus propionicus DSM 13327 TaxID=1123291 RepID=A0A1I4QQH3_9FIRM|nr:hypothetical protein [Pelosinus propionicus]SFM41956.1 hypothetical protein SAMN04490355_11172 [Pelosinus propionicus DSM 13327]